MEHETQARAIYDEAHDMFVATVLQTGETHEASDSDEIAAWLSVAGVEHGRVSMPRELIESAGDRVNINYMMRLIQHAEIKSRTEARDWRLGSAKSARLAQFITSSEFLERAKAAVAKAIDELEARGIKPAYIKRRQ